MDVDRADLDFRYRDQDFGAAAGQHDTARTERVRTERVHLHLILDAGRQPGNRHFSRRSAKGLIVDGSLPPAREDADAGADALGVLVRHPVRRVIPQQRPPPDQHVAALVDVDVDLDRQVCRRRAFRPRRGSCASPKRMHEHAVGHAVPEPVSQEIRRAPVHVIAPRVVLSDSVDQYLGVAAVGKRTPRNPQCTVQARHTQLNVRWLGNRHRRGNRRRRGTGRGPRHPRAAAAGQHATVPTERVHQHLKLDAVRQPKKISPLTVTPSVVTVAVTHI